MNAQSFLKNFGHLANAPGGVKRLREMLLHYAVSGRLVEQRNSEGHASVAIAEATELRDQFQSDHKLRKRKLAGPLRADEVPYSTPVTWKWERLETIASYIQRGKGPKYAASGKGRVVSQKCIQWSGFDLTLARTISDESIEKYGEERFLKENDLLWNSTGTGTAGRIAIFNCNEKLIVADSHVTVIRLTNFIPQYIWCYLASPLVQVKMVPNQEGSMVSGTTNQIELSTTKVSELPVPCPPVAEQKRIVAKVDELMALCDKLEVQQQERERLFPVLSRAIHTRFVESPTLENLESIFNAVDCVDLGQLRISILSLAFQGCLVGQDPADESARKLLRKLLAHRSNHFEIHKDSSDLHSTPKSWVWTSLGNYAVCSRGRFSIRPRNDPAFYGGEYPFIQIRDLSDRGGQVTRHAQTLNEKGLSVSRMFSKGTVVIAIVGATIGNTGILAYDMCFPDSLVGLDTGDLESNRYVELYLRFKKSRFRELSYQGGGQPNIKLQLLNPFPFPLPPLAEQYRIVAKVDQLMALVDQLEERQSQKSKVAATYAQAAVAVITGTQTKEPEPMRAHKSELITKLETGTRPKTTEGTPLATLIAKHKGPLSAKTLWQQSGLEIDAFYQQLKTEMANGWIVEPEPAIMQEVEAS